MEQEVMQAIRTELSDSWCPHSGFATDCKSDSKRPL